VINPFNKFETFGIIANREKRKKIARTIFEHMLALSEQSIGIPNSETENFTTAVDTILAHESIRSLCKQQDPSLIEKITIDILDFINNTKKTINKTADPFVKEQELKDIFKNSNKEKFQDDWKVVKRFIFDTYDSKKIDTSFYEKEFKNSIDKNNSEGITSHSFESILEHFIEKWSALILEKQAKWEQEIIELERRRFCNSLFEQIEELEKLQEILEPFTNEISRLWDLSKGKWQNVNFDILNRYAELLKKDKALQDLAEMLGRMRQTEKELEEKSFSTIDIQQQWKLEYASKADLIGIKESDDLSSLLPTETALLADETMQFIFFKKFAEKKLQTFEYQANILSNKEDKNKKKDQDEDEQGPFIICVDTSGSMHGTAETVSKTLCFAILKIAIRDNRKCFLISYSTQLMTLNLTDFKTSIDKLIEFLSMSFNGCTDATPAMQEALNLLETDDFRKADIIMLSDFIMPDFELPIQLQILKAKEKKTQFHSLVIGTIQNPTTIKDFDNNWLYDTNNPNSMLTLVKNLKTF